MKLKNYLAIVIFGCLFSGFGIEYVLTSQFDDLNRLAQLDTSNRLASIRDEHMRSAISQFLVSSDLIMGSGESYLVPGATQQARLIDTELGKSIENSNGDLPRHYSQIRSSIAKVANMLEEAATYNGANRQNKLNALLYEFDPLATDIVEQSDHATLYLTNESEHSARQLAEEQKFARTVSISVGLAFLLVVLGAWRWLTLMITRPIHLLSERANETTAKDSFVGISSGPVEVRALSDRFEALTRKLVYQATHDPLTRLLNRREFERRLEAIRIGRRHDERSSVLCYIDLDQFKIVNDTCGHAAGDELLCMVSDAFLHGVRETDVVARLGGDEFCILLKGCELGDGIATAETLRSSVEAIRFNFDNQVFRISASIGVAEVVHSQSSCEAVVEQADAACAVAKESGRNRIYVFNLNDEKVDQRRLDISWLNQINAALDQDDFVLYRQSIVPILPNSDTGDRYELLIRMRDKLGNIVSPAKFLPVAERYNMSSRLDKWVLTKALAWLVENPQELAQLSCVSINLSGQSLSQPNFMVFAQEAIVSSGIDGSKICFEITETSAISDIESAKTFIQSLRKLDCQFALDDFGTGHSSFSYLRDLPVDTLKIDGSFVRNYLVNNVDKATVDSLVGVAKACDKKIVAEFIESRELLNAMGALGVDYAQGYYCGEPHELGAEGSAACNNATVG